MMIRGDKYTLFKGDCLDILKEIPDDSIDSIVTDAPYGLGSEPDALEMLKDWVLSGYHEAKASGGFMGKKWDNFVPQPIVWKECLRILKPGGHLLCFSGTRTYDLTTLAIRIAGFEIRDCIKNINGDLDYPAWVYASGFPKNLNLSKAAEKTNDTELAAKARGYGTALKPAWEPIVVARKPINGTILSNFEKHNTGCINIEGCRVPLLQNFDAPRQINKSGGRGLDGWRLATAGSFECLSALGRWPANVIHDGSDEVMSQFPIAKGQLASVDAAERPKSSGVCYGEIKRVNAFKARVEATKSAARFFYCAKPSKSEKNEGVCLERYLRMERHDKPAGNFHPTVKPVALMRYLVRLVTPRGGVCLDQYMGSGSTGVACAKEGFDFIGIDNDAEGTFWIAEARVPHAYKKASKPRQFSLFSEESNTLCCR